MATDGSSGPALNPTVDFIAGTVAGMAGLVVGFPFDTVKVRFQSPAIAAKYHSTFHAITTIVREERFVGLYKGVTSPLATVALMNGLVFASYRFLLKAQLPTSDSVPTLAQIALAGAGCGIVSSIVTTPTELVKIRQQALLTPTTARSVARGILRDAGVWGLYRGLPVTALRDCGYGAYFAAYEAACRYLATPDATGTPQLSIPAMLIAGGIAGVAGWVVTFPLDVVKTRVQGSAPIFEPAVASASKPVTSAAPGRLLARIQQRLRLRLGDPERASLLHGGVRQLHSSGLVLSTGAGDAVASPKMCDVNPYRTMWTTIVHSYRAEGASVFWRGLAPTLIRAIPVNMVTFAAFEAVVHVLS